MSLYCSRSALATPAMRPAPKQTTAGAVVAWRALQLWPIPSVMNTGRLARIGPPIIRQASAGSECATEQAGSGNATILD